MFCVKENCGSFCCRNHLFLLLAEGHAVGALVHGGIHFVGTDHDLVQRAVVFVAAMVGALLDSTLDAFVGMAIHKRTSFDLDSELVCTVTGKVCWENSPTLHSGDFCGIVLLRKVWKQNF